MDPEEEKDNWLRLHVVYCVGVRKKQRFLDRISFKFCYTKKSGCVRGG